MSEEDKLPPEKYPICCELGLKMARTQWLGSYGWQYVIDAAAVEDLLRDILKTESNHDSGEKK